MRLEAGYQVTPHVRLVRLLRKGGMGSVWAAEHLALRTQVAVKFMAAAYAEDEAMVTRFTREAAYAAQIKSPHVVHVYDHGITEEGLPFIVMELLDGEDLAERVQRLGPLPVLEVARILSQLCKALGKAHQADIVHRDIKLNNVFLMDADGDPFVKLLDFGIAKQHGRAEGHDVTTTGAMVGTLVYMSPEQLHNAKEVDFRTDLWSLGVVVYRTLTGKLPFRDDDGIGALLLAVNSGKFKPASELRPELPAAVDGWFQRALARDPELRFTSAREMSEAFDLAVGRETTAVSSARLSATPRPVAPTLLDPAEQGSSPELTSPPGSTTESTSAGVVHAQTLVGAEATRPGKGRGLGWMAAAGLAMGVLGALSVALLGRGQGTQAPAPGGAGPAAAAAAEATVQTAGSDPRVAPTVAPVVVPAVAPAPSVEAAPPAPSASSSAAASAAAPPGPATAPRVSGPRPASTTATPAGAGSPKPVDAKPAGPRPGGTIKKEKDYGF